VVEHIVSTYSRCGGLVDNLLSLHKEGAVVSWLSILSVHTAGVVVSWIIYCHYIKKVRWFRG
jgi:energy-converting hydrogenase Eha subunit F